MTPMEQSERKGLVDRLPELRKIAEAATPGPWHLAGTEAKPCPVVSSRDQTKGYQLHSMLHVKEIDPDVWSLMKDAYNRDAKYIAAFDPPTVLALLDLLSSDARPAPMADEVKAALLVIRRRIRTLNVADTEAVSVKLDTLSAHIDNLTRKVAEAEEVAHYANGVANLAMKHRDEAEAALSRPQETDAVLAEREACAQVADEVCEEQMALSRMYRERDRIEQADSTELVAIGARTVASSIRSRPSPGPATETDRKDGRVSPFITNHTGIDVARKIEAVRLAAYDDSGNEPSRSVLNRAIDDLYDVTGRLLASVRPKEEGV